MVCCDNCYYILLKSLVPIFIENRIILFIKNRCSLWNFLSIGSFLIRKKKFDSSFCLAIAAVQKLVYVLVLIKLISFASLKAIIIRNIYKFELWESLDRWLLCAIKYSLIPATKAVVLGGLIIVGHLVDTLVIPLSIVDDQVGAGLRNLHVGVEHRVVERHMSLGDYVITLILIPTCCVHGDLGLLWFFHHRRNVDLKVLVTIYLKVLVCGRVTPFSSKNFGLNDCFFLCLFTWSSTSVCVTISCCWIISLLISAVTSFSLLFLTGGFLSLLDTVVSRCFLHFAC